MTAVTFSRIFPSFDSLTQRIGQSLLDRRPHGRFDFGESDVVMRQMACCSRLSSVSIISKEFSDYPTKWFRSKK